MNETSVHTSNFSPFLRSSIICKAWLTVINTWLLLPSEGDTVISSTFVQGIGKMESTPFSVEILTFYKSLLVGECEVIQSPSCLAPKWHLSAAAEHPRDCDQAFMYVSRYYCVSTVTLERLWPFMWDRHGLTASDR